MCFLLIGVVGCGWVGEVVSSGDEPVVSEKVDGNSYDPIGEIASLADVGGGISGEVVFTPWPTFTPVAEGVDVFPTLVKGGDEDVVDVGLGSVIPTREVGPLGLHLVNKPDRFTCEIGFRQWLKEYQWGNGVGLYRGLPEFRSARLDCNEVVFPFEISVRSDCGVGPRVGGILVSGGLTYRTGGSRLEVGDTKRDAAGNMLIHFSRMPGTRDGEGCWYYSAAGDSWYEAYDMIDGYRVGGGSGGGDGDLGSGGEIRGLCNGLLQRTLLEEEEMGLNGDVVQEVIGRIQTGVLECSVGWDVEVSDESLAYVCPDGDTGWHGGDLVVHWELAPVRGDSCWVYMGEGGYWVVE